MRSSIVCVVLIVMVCLLFSGCPAVRMSPAYRQTVESSAIRVAELDNRCQNGDAVACKEGLAAASRTLDLIVDALYGYEGDYED